MTTMTHCGTLTSIGWASRRSAPTATALGGLPTGVAVPPILAAKATPSTSALRNGSLFSSCATSGAAIASIIAVVAVADIHMANSAVITISPSSTIRGLLPKIRSITAASARCSL